MSRPMRPWATRLIKPTVTAESSVLSSPPPVQEMPLERLLEELRVSGDSRGNLIGETLGSAIEAIWANRTRSFLTILGVVIGVAAVIGALTLTQGVAAYIDNIIVSQGANTIEIWTSAPGNGGNVHPLTPQDLQSLGNLSHVAAISPLIQVGDGQLTYGNQNWHTTRVQGVGIDFQTIQNWQLAEGLWFSPSEEAGGEPVAIIGDTVMHNLFDASRTDPIGQKIQLNGQLFKVVGVLAPKGGGNQDDVVFIPYKTIQTRLFHRQSNSLGEIDVKVDTRSNIDQVVQEITTTLEVNHRIPSGSPRDFEVQTSIERLQESDQASQVITEVLTGIAAISLTIAGVGIMNIMLVSVTERTREIGIRMSVGARRRDIRNQFLAEALFLCLLGGVAGLLFGILIGWLMVNVIVVAVTGVSVSGGVPLIITASTLVLPFAVSVAVGIIFGLYPAIRASRLDPIVALRRTK